MVSQYFKVKKVILFTLFCLEEVLQHNIRVSWWILFLDNKCQGAFMDNRKKLKFWYFKTKKKEFPDGCLLLLFMKILFTSHSGQKFGKNYNTIWTLHQWGKFLKLTSFLGYTYFARFLGFVVAASGVRPFLSSDCINAYFTILSSNNHEMHLKLISRKVALCFLS